MGLIIRNIFRAGDIGRIIYLHGILYAKEHGYDNSFESYVAVSLCEFAQQENSRERIWLIDGCDSLLGSIALCEISENEAQLRWFLVSPELRGQGVGKRLIHSLIVFAQQQKYKYISLWTVEGLHAAKNIYRSYGFTLKKEVTRYIWGEIRTEQLYTLHLNEFNKPNEYLDIMNKFNGHTPPTIIKT